MDGHGNRARPSIPNNDRKAAKAAFPSFHLNIQGVPRSSLVDTFVRPPRCRRKAAPWLLEQFGTVVSVAEATQPTRLNRIHFPGNKTVKIGKTVEILR